MNEDHEGTNDGPPADRWLHDPVTGLADATLFEERTGQALKHAQRKRLAFSVAIFHIDRFDSVAASLGPGDAERLLEELGRRLQSVGRAEDTIAYLGGGAFAALLAGAAGPSEAGAAVGSILVAVGEPLTLGARDLRLTASMGVVVYPSDGVTVVELLSNAEAATNEAIRPKLALDTEYEPPPVG